MSSNSDSMGGVLSGEHVKGGRAPRALSSVARPETRTLRAIGDPQTTFKKFQSVLDHHGLLGRDGLLRKDVSLLSIGDHFDFHREEGPCMVSGEGVRLLRWLADHPADQAIILAGNHDVARVMEFAGMTDERFGAARTMAEEVVRLKKENPSQGVALEEQFSKSYPELPPSGVVGRDYRSFTVEQRALVQELLLKGRMRLAQAGLKRGRPILLTHAGVTEGDLKILGIPAERDPVKIARRLNEELAQAVSCVRGAWQRDGAAALDFKDLHKAGRNGQEGGGLLYHRPACEPDKTKPAPPLAPRRFQPQELPRGLVQACGHTVHGKCLGQLEKWAEGPAKSKDLRELRTLRVNGSKTTYEAKDAPAMDGEAVLYMIDGAMDHVPAENYALLEIEEWLDLPG